MQPVLGDFGATNLESTLGVSLRLGPRFRLLPEVGVLHKQFGEESGPERAFQFSLGFAFDNEP